MEQQTKITLTLVLALVCGPAHAFRRCGGCVTHHHAVQHVQHAVAVALPITVYQTSVGLEIEAAVEKSLRDRGFAPTGAVPYGAAPQLQQQQAPLQQQQQARQPQGSVLQAKCASCHANADSSGGSAWDMSGLLTDHAFVRITEMIGEQVSVPDQMQQVVANLQPNEKASILSEIINLKKYAREGMAGDRPRAIVPVQRPQRTYVSPYGRV